MSPHRILAGGLHAPLPEPYESPSAQLAARVAEGIAERQRAEAEQVRAERLAAETIPAPATPVCTTCNDTHVMELDDDLVMCTRCPIPCEACRGGAFCRTTPCGCECHRPPAAVWPEPEGGIAGAVAAAATEPVTGGEPMVTPIECPVCMHDETIRARHAGCEPCYDGLPVMHWRRESGIGGQTVTRWSRGTWTCESCGACLSPHDAGVMLDAALMHRDPNCDSIVDGTHEDARRAFAGGMP